MEVTGSPELLTYPLVARELTPDSTVIEVRGRRIGDGFFGLIAGPCTVETREQTLETARAVAAAGASVLRGGAFKPRSSPYAFQGLGRKGLEILAEARAETGLPIVTEVVPLTAFYKAEDYHQGYYRGNPAQPYCSLVVGPKVAKARKAFAEKLKKPS